VPALLKSEAFLLRSAVYGEADQVLTLLGRDCGKTPCFARASRGSKRRFGSALQPFQKLEVLLRPRGGSMALLDSVQVLHSYGQLWSDWDRMNAAYRLLELAEQLEEEESVHTAFFDVLEAGFEGISNAKDPDAAALRCEASLLDLAGWAPRLDACVSCRREAPFSKPRLSLSEGGLLCHDCRAEGSWLALGPGAASALQRLFEGREGSVAEAKSPLRRFVEYQLGKSLNTERFERSLRTTP
jgi:DNA repair protein RecO (recombination protein O)